MSTPIETAADFPDTPAGWAQRWAVELKAFRDASQKWHEDGERILDVFEDRREAEDKNSRCNLFTANVQMQQALLFGSTPRVDVGRRFADAADDEARVAGEMLERLLNADIRKDGDTYSEALAYALSDYLLPGLGMARVRYVVETEQGEDTPAKMDPTTGRELAPMVPGGLRKTYECAETDYVHWKDFAWSPCRVWHEVRWVGFRAEMSREQLAKRFGKEVAQDVPMKSTQAAEDKEKKAPDPWARAEVWEIWDKASKRAYWYVEGHSQTLDIKEDPLRLRGFFPCPRPLLANWTTRKVEPRPDYVLAQDAYEEVNILTARITLLTEAVRVAGVYDRQNTGLQDMLSGRAENKLHPVENWAMFAERGGVRGAVDWLPLDQIVAALTTLVQQRAEVKANLYEVTGMSDLMRGMAAHAGASATEQGIKAKFASVRLQRKQDEFARFASDVQRLKAEVIANFFDPETILRASNMERTADAALAQQAVALVKDRFSDYRIEVKPESVSLTDFAQLKSERLEVMQGIAQFFGAMAPVAQQMPGSMPYVLKVLQWVVSGLPGASQMEGMLDGAIDAAQQAAQQPQQQQPDPKVLVEQMKAQNEREKIDAELKADIARAQAEVAADAQREQNQMIYNVQEARAKQQISTAARAQQTAMNPGAPGQRRGQ